MTTFILMERGVVVGDTTIYPTHILTVVLVPAGGRCMGGAQTHGAAVSGLDQLDPVLHPQTGELAAMQNTVNSLPTAETGSLIV